MTEGATGRIKGSFGRVPGPRFVGGLLLALAIGRALQGEDGGEVLVGPAMAEDGPSQMELTVTVEAEGLGTTPDAALKNAFRAAVQQAVGLLVDEKTLIENDKLISDSVLTYSDGLVQTYETLAPPAPARDINGMYRTRIRAVVLNRDVSRKLEAVPAYKAKLDGKGMFANAVSAASVVEDGRKMLLALKEEIKISDLLIARVIDDKGHTGDEAEVQTEVNVNAGTTTVSVKIQVYEDAEAYFTRVVPRILPLYQKLSMFAGRWAAQRVQLPDPTDLDPNQYPAVWNDWYKRDEYTRSGWRCYRQQGYVGAPYRPEGALDKSTKPLATWWSANYQLGSFLGLSKAWMQDAAQNVKNVNSTGYKTSVLVTTGIKKRMSGQSEVIDSHGGYYEFRGEWYDGRHLIPEFAGVPAELGINVSFLDEVGAEVSSTFFPIQYWWQRSFKESREVTAYLPGQGFNVDTNPPRGQVWCDVAVVPIRMEVKSNLLSRVRRMDVSIRNGE